MPRFRATVTETRAVVVEFEADNLEEAQEMAVNEHPAGGWISDGLEEVVLEGVEEIEE